MFHAAPSSNVPDVDMAYFGTVIVHNWDYINMRSDNDTGYTQLIQEINDRFYTKPISCFKDEMVGFKKNMTGNSDMYNSVISFVMDITLSLDNPVNYFKRILSDFNTLIANVPENQILKIGFNENDYLECIFFSLRFYIDRAELYRPVETKGGK